MNFQLVSAIVAFKFTSFRRHPLRQFPGPVFCALSNAGPLQIYEELRADMFRFPFLTTGLLEISQHGSNRFMPNTVG